MDWEDEFVKSLTEHQPVIRAFIISLLPGAADVDDVIQETNSVLWRRRGDFEPGTNFRAWALAIARFQSLNHRRQLARRNWVTLDEDVAELLAEDFESACEAGGELAHALRIEALRGCLARLRRKDHDLLLERYWRKSRLRDFAVTARRSEGGLRVRLFRLRGLLKRCIERELQGQS